MINNKGLSDVVTTVLIILLAIAAIAIVWGFVQPTIREAGEGLSTSCIQTEVEAKNCVIDNSGAIPTANVTYQWKSGENLDSVKIVISDGSNSGVFEAAKPSTTLATATEEDIDLSESALDLGVSSTVKASVISVITTTSGETQTCSAENTVEITCDVIQP